MSRILIVDDEPAIGWSLRELLSDEGHAVEVAASVEAGLETCGRQSPEAILLDVRLPGRDGISALPDFRRIVPESPIIVMTAFGDLDTAVRAVEAGAYDYLVKPFDMSQVSRVVARSLAEQRRSGTATTSTPSGSIQLVGGSLPMQTVFKQIALAAPTDLPVLITGETGTGKELAARAIHAHSSRRDGPLVVSSLAALSPTVVESELFGHVRGAFTGAVTDRTGLFEEADGGTIFLDEVGDAPLDVQAKLLRVLENREVTPVGSAIPRRVDVRIIAATNTDLPAAIAAGRFRADLHHRLRVFPIAMPSLAERAEDIPMLVDAFLRHREAKAPAASPAFMEAVRGRSWPGNVRELRHAVEYAAVVARGGTLQPEHLPPPETAPRGPAAVGESPVGSASAAPADVAVATAVRAWVKAHWPDADDADLHEQLVKLVESGLLEEALVKTGGNRSAAARALGLDRTTLRSKLER
ncbi:MAG: sigma-54-dependent transcriptional regulator [Planctomycetia bacterium]